MAKTKIIQNSMVSGVMNDKAFGRTDITKYYNSVAEGTNVIVQTTGGMFKRPGLEFIHQTSIPLVQADTAQTCRLVDFSFNTEQKYIFVIYPGKIDLYNVPNRDTTLDPTGPAFLSINAPEFTATVIKEMSYVQRGDLTIFFHETLQPRVLTRTGAQTFTFSILNIIPPRLIDDTTPYWSTALGWPKFGTFFQGRLYCAGNTKYPLTVWGSKSQSYFDFYIAPANAAADGSPIIDTIDSDKINAITGIYSGRSLQVFTTGAEFVNTATIITPLASAWHIQTRYGTNPNVSLDSLDGSTFYVDRNNAVREFIYDFNQDSFVSNDLTTLSTQLFNRPFRLSIVKSAETSLGRYTYVLNADGTMAILNFNKAEQIIAWVKFQTSTGPIIDMAIVDNEVYLLIKAKYGVNLERVDLSNRSTYLDSHVYSYGDKTTTVCGTTPLDTINCSLSVGGANAIDYLLDNKWCPDCKIFADPLTPPIAELIGLERFEGMMVSVILDGIYQGEQLVTNGRISINKLFVLIEVGLKFDSIMKTLPLSSAGGDIELSNKRIIKIKFYLYQSSGFYIDGDFIPSTSFDIDNYDTKATVRTGLYEYWTLGWDTLKDFTISNADPLGFNILKFETHVDVTE